MPNIRPISDLRSYIEVLNTISNGEPLFLTKNGRGRFAVLHMADYEKMIASLKLITKLSEGEESAKKEGWISFDNVSKILGDA